ncbi:signal-transducing adaptor protein 2 isoform X3 [Monodelphis domestica]|uniref:signal-transducing adaptor protein 2 isoform X3 n=1 Tax=Monodelphis domestica TaxID=13616 RepID=UPI0024E21B04|nr:signal-transducing adaptor protein 2 isoform X3 [Monodelphis domestica]
MATAPGLPRVPKSKPTFPSHYHEGFLEKKGPKDRDYKKFWAGLQGLTIYFYNSNRDPQYVDKVDLSNFLALTDDAPRGSTTDPGTQFCLSLAGQEIRFKVDSLESREMWKAFIMTVVELKVPSNLLPGPKYTMTDVLTKEKDRRAQEKPSCFLDVSRVEAQLLLEKYPDCGNMLLRPGSDGSGSFSVTTRQMLNGVEQVRHYKVKREGRSYIIDVEEPVSCSSLHDVVNYFISNTKGALVPFHPDEDYEKVLGEAKQTQQLPGPGRSPRLPTSVPPVPDQDENYITPISDEPTNQYENENEVAPFCRLKAPALPPRLLAGPKPKRQGKPLPKVPAVPHKAKTGRAVLPEPSFPSRWPVPEGPLPPPSLSFPESKGLAGPKKGGSSASQPRVPSGMPISTEMTEELERKLQQRRAILEK